MVVLEKPSAIRPINEPWVRKCVAILGYTEDAGEGKWLLVPRDDGDANAVIVELTGELSIFTAAAVKDLIDDLIEHNRHFKLVLSIQGLRYIDCTGFGVLMTSLRRLRTLNGVVVFACTNPQFRYLLDVTGASNSFRTFENERAALNALGTGKPNYTVLDARSRILY
jgi:stage II sporulation protein AA (anti-sigma F factor antagonist)